jgi:radical SAM superfamily enzyme YgiQ (UPF0313 family)
LNGEVFAFDGREPRPCDAGETKGIHRAVADAIDQARHAVAGNQAQLELTGPEAAGEVFREILAKAGGWSVDALVAEREKFDQAYVSGMPVAPPNRKGDLVVVTSAGCSNRDCSFCAFDANGPAQPFSFKQWEAHLDAVKRLHGASLDGFKGIFMGAGSFMEMSQRVSLKVLTLLEQQMGARPRGVCAFLDPDHYQQRQPSDFTELKQAGLRQVIICVESGIPSLRHFLGKKAPLEQVIEILRNLKRAGLQVGITVWVGEPGQELEKEHLTRTRAMAASLPLDRDDYIYLAPHRPFPAEIREQQFDAYRTALSGSSPARILPFPKHPVC